MYGKQRLRLGRAPQHSGNNRGIALVSALMFLAVLALLGSNAASVTTLYSQIRGNYKASIQAFQAAEAGAEEARARLRGNATSPIVDAFPTLTQWQAYIGSLTQAQGYGYTSGAQQVRVDSLQNSVQYTVVIAHATNDSDGAILLWGDPNGTGINIRNTVTGQNIYQITSYGSMAGARSTVRTQVARLPSIPLLGTLYVEAPTTIQGTSTNIIGNDDCGTIDRPGIVTPLGSTTNGSNTITQHGNPTISGTPPIMYNGQNLNIQALVNAHKGAANFAYTVQSTTHTGSTTPGPGEQWGTPTPGATLQRASSCSVFNTVHYNTGGTYIRLSGGVTGCGVLLVEGDLEVHGGFQWYGPIVVTGSVIYTGGGNKNVTGAILSGGSVTADVIGGNSNLVNCSSAVTNQAQNSPLVVLNWGTL